MSRLCRLQQHVAVFDSNARCSHYAGRMKWIYAGFGTRLRQARKAAGLSQEELAKVVGLARTSITNIEKGRQNFTLHVAYDLAAAVGLPVSSLLSDKPPIYSDSVHIPLEARER